MKNIKKLSKVGLSLSVFTILLSGTCWHPAEAYNDNTLWVQNQNQIRFQDMTSEQRQEMLRLLTQLHVLLQKMLQLRSYDYVNSELQIATQLATNIETNEAVLRGEVTDFNLSDYADVWFEYDTSRVDFDQRTDTERIMSDEDGDFEQKITGLEENTTYYFRAVGEDDEEDLDYGMVFNFHTDSDQQEDPDVTTLSAIDITEDSAVLRGSVDMNDFHNGRVFFVYGEDEDRIGEIADDLKTYEDIDEFGDGLQRIMIDVDLDDSDSYEEEISSLDEDTKHYFNLCVTYEENDNGDVIACGDIHSFTTDL
jgi:hypothetical protein